MYSLNLEQHVLDTTHEKGHILDLVITRATESSVSDLKIHPSAVSDHFPISFSLPWKRPSAPKKEIHCRKTKDIELDKFIEDIGNSELVTSPPSDVSQLVELYDRTLSSVLDKHAPLTVKTITVRNNSPWFNDEIKEAKRKRRKAERKWRKTKLQVHLEIFKVQHNKVMALCKQAKSTYYCDKIDEFKDDYGKLFQLTNNLMFRKQQLSLPTHSCPKDLADKFIHYFSDKIAKIKDEFTDEQTRSTSEVVVDSTASQPSFTEFAPIDGKSLEKIILKGNSKSCGLDPLPTKLLKSSLPVLLPTLCRIVNQSLSSGVMPDSLKIAQVTPLLKKPSLDVEDFKHFRPVSNLPYIGKLIERVAVAQMDTHMTTHSLHEVYQSAYRAHHSTESALLRVSNDVLRSIDRRRCVLLTLLDLSAAFDTVDHGKFLDRLESSFGVTGRARQWLESYFRERYQAVHINSSSSVRLPLTTGFPQGSVIGPFGFKPYTKPLSAIAAKHNVSIHLYADDTQLYVSCDPEDIESAVCRMEACIRDIRKWMHENHLKLNDSKTEFLTLGTKHQLSQLGDVSIRIGEESILASASARNIGVLFDQEMNMKEQVNQIMRACYGQVRGIAQIRQFLTTKAAEILVHAFVTSRLDNHNSLLHGVPDYLLDRLQMIQNQAARIITKQKRSDHITQTLIDLHWLPIKYRIQYKMLLFAYKSQQSAAPVYLSDLLSPYIPSRTLRSEQQLRLEQPRARSTRYGERSFSVAAPRLWNDLPVHVKEADTLETFKTRAKTYLFRKAFNVQS